MNTLCVNAQVGPNIGIFDSDFEYAGSTSYGSVFHFSLTSPLSLQIDFPNSPFTGSVNGSVYLVKVENGINKGYETVSSPIDIPIKFQWKLDVGNYYILIAISELQDLREFQGIQSIDILISGSESPSGEVPEIISPIARPNPVLAPLTENRIISRTYTKENEGAYLDNIQFYDGLGRITQTTQKAITRLKKDLITFQGYDGFYRESITWLPFIHSGETTADIKGQYGDEYPFQETRYEVSALNRHQNIFPAGADWQTTKHVVSYRYLINIPTEKDLKIRMFFCNDGIITSAKTMDSGNSGMYAVEKMTNEDGNQSYTFKDLKGRTVLTRNIVGDEQYDTYYVYDFADNLCYVLPPILSSLMDQQAKDEVANSWNKDSEGIKQYAYVYEYDAMKRCIFKKLPGCEPVYYIYDKADRLIFTQDGEQRNKNPKEWTFSIPDIFGRVVLTGICKNTFDYAANSLGNDVIKATYNTGRTNLANSYTVTGITLTNPTILSANYYDNYDFRGMAEIPSSGTEYITDVSYGIWYGTDYTIANKYKSQGLLTGTLTAQLNKIDANSPDFLYSVMYYDDKKQLIQSKSTNHLGGLEKESIAYNFTGQPIQRKHVHSATGNNVQTEIYAYTYDHAGRLLKTVHHLIDGASAQTPVTLVENEYDELGRLKTNMKGGRAELNTTYTYNIRSWTKSISSPLFNQTLYYNESYGGSAKRYNGNIAGMTWKVWDSATSKWEKERGYSFTYDNLSRLTVANYLENGMVNTNYRTSYSYNKHGNLITLNQRGRKDASLYGQVDSLKMTYSGNQLTKVTDAVPNFAYAASADFKNYGGSNAIYTYNLNGAMATDSHKGILGIKYNSLNLPYELLIKNTEVSGKVYYTYSASGAKLKTKHMKAKNLGYTPVTGTAGDTNLDVIKTTDYVGSMVYENDSLKRVLVDGGYIEVTRVNGVNQYAYNYYLTDHLGNNRVVANARGIPIQRNHYYPFGMTFAENSTAEQGMQPYKYNGKELDQMHGLNMYDYSARFYEPAIGRFTTVDPLAEKYYSISPYVYCNNNPINYVDPDGKAWRPTHYTKLNGNQVPTGYSWVAKEDSYHTNGKLKEGLYEQAIFFSDNGTFSFDKRFNMGSSTATVYMADGTTVAFDACTYPSKSTQLTIPEGNYKAVVGLHKSTYTALRMTDDGTMWGKIQLPFKNPNNPNVTYAIGVNVHKPGEDNLTRGQSVACFNIDINRWNEFIGIFNNSEQKSNVIGIGVSRTLSVPTNKDGSLGSTLKAIGSVLVSPITVPASAAYGAIENLIKNTP